MNYIYHSAPDLMVGNELMPLNFMKDKYPELYNFHASKYEGRKEIMKRKITLLNCLWNHVIQFLPLNPIKVFELQIQLGIIEELPNLKFYEVDPIFLDNDKTIIYLKSAPGEENIKFKWIKNVNLADFQQIPTTTINYYKTLQGTGELPFNYQFIPHILYMGTIDAYR